MRYAAIRNCQINQSALIQKMEMLREELLVKCKIANANRKPDHFNAAFRTMVVECARTDENRQRMEKLLNFSPYNFKAKLQSTANAKYEKTKQLLSVNSAKIEFLAKDIFEDMRKLRTEEMYDRAQTIKALRFKKNWSQKILGEKIKEIFPCAASSQSTISRI